MIEIISKISDRMNKKKLYIILGILVVVLAIVIILIAVISPQKKLLTVAFLNVRQGDSIYIESPNGYQMIVDGGPDATVLRELGSVMPFYDRSIDILVATHPDKDHIAGLVDVMQNFSVGGMLRPELDSDTSVYKLFESTLTRLDISDNVATRGARIHLDDDYGVYADVLHPAYDVSRVRDTNDGSIVLRLVYGETEFLLTGDATLRIEDELVTKGNSQSLASDVLKLGHHGSKTSSGENFLRAVSPEIAVISAGCDNQYGHPHREVTDRVENLGIQMIDICSYGTIIMQSDGEHIWVK